ncbi:MAG: type II toxin-antitoxin system RelE/ParE family toxin [Desulfosarcinaceae bacterium]
MLPSKRFKALTGDRKGQYSIRINDQWCICFEWGMPALSRSKLWIVIKGIRSWHEIRFQMVVAIILKLRYNEHS